MAVEEVAVEEVRSLYHHHSFHQCHRLQFHQFLLVEEAVEQEVVVEVVELFQFRHHSFHHPFRHQMFHPFLALVEVVLVEVEAAGEVERSRFHRR